MAGQDQDDAIHDDFHPSTQEPEPCTIIVGSRGQYATIVDYEDYSFLVRWKWTFKRSSPKYAQAIYARRCTWVRVNGIRRKKTLYLHLVILERAGAPKPPGDLITGDHFNGRTLDNRRKNLGWKTKKEQRANQRKWK